MKACKASRCERLKAASCQVHTCWSQCVTVKIVLQVGMSKIQSVRAPLLRSSQLLMSTVTVFKLLVSAIWYFVDLKLFLLLLTQLTWCHSRLTKWDKDQSHSSRTMEVTSCTNTYSRAIHWNWYFFHCSGPWWCSQSHRIRKGCWYDWIWCSMYWHGRQERRQASALERLSFVTCSSSSSRVLGFSQSRESSLRSTLVSSASRTSLAQAYM